EVLLHDLALLVDLDGVDAAVGAAVLVLAYGRLEGVADLGDAMAKDVGEAEQDRQLDAAGLELIDQLLQVDRLFGSLAGMNGDVPGLVDGEVALAPVTDSVGFEGILDLPLVHQVGRRAFWHRSGLHEVRITEATVRRIGSTRRIVLLVTFSTVHVCGKS